MLLMPCDIILTRSGSKMGNVIIFIQNKFQKDIINYNHALMVIDKSSAIEANWSGISIVNPFSVLSKTQNYKIVRKKYLTKKQCKGMIKAVKSLQGLSYSYIRLIMQLLDQIFFTNFFTNIIKSNKSQICSSFIAWAYYIWCNIEFNGVNWRSCEPDDIEDEIENNFSDWGIVVEK